MDRGIFECYNNDEYVYKKPMHIYFKEEIVWREKC